jgi:hypothetical protein
MQKGIFIKPTMTPWIIKVRTNADPDLKGMVDPDQKNVPVRVMAHTECENESAMSVK